MNVEYPALYFAADAAARRAQTHHVAIVRLHGLLLLLAAILGLVGMEERWAATVDAVVITGSIVVSSVMLARRDEAEWYRARALAESVKTSAWRFMVAAQPYLRTDGSAEQTFGNRIRSLLEEHADLAGRLSTPAAQHAQVTDQMRSVRARCWRDRGAFYALNRIAEQRAWYIEKAESNRSLGRRWAAALVAAQAAATGLAILRVAAPDFRYWPVEVFLVAASFSMTWMQVRRHRELAAAYSLTAHEVSLIATEFEGVNSEAHLAAFVVDSESAFSREHTQWLARKDRP